MRVSPCDAKRMYGVSEARGERMDAEVMEDAVFLRSMNSSQNGALILRHVRKYRQEKQ